MNSFIIFFRFNFIAFTNEKNNIPSYLDGKKYRFFEEKTNINHIFEWFLDEKNTENAIVICSNLHNVIKECLSKFKLIKAAGGIVQNSENKYLLILRNERWDLPKGKAEPNETLNQTALREVEEETGVGNLVDDGLICKTYHVYYMFEEWILKQTSWYDMHTLGNTVTPTTPQTEEGIELAEWVEKEDVMNRLENSYAMLSYLSKVWNSKNK
jgi:8-oxo-dGTP pyrophosphatase MutT (NUDIX family)